MIVAMALFVGCKGQSGHQQAQGNDDSDSTAAVTVKYATGFSVKDSADMRLVDIDKNYHFAFVFGYQNLYKIGYLSLYHFV